MNVPSLNDSDVQTLIKRLKLQIKFFNDGVTNTLSETMEEAKMVLNKRSSDGKTFMISKINPTRSKLKYQFEKAETIWKAKIRAEAISENDVPSLRRVNDVPSINDSDVQKAISENEVPSLNDSDVQSVIDGLKLQIKCFNDGVTNTLSETMEEAKMLLNERSSDGKTFMISTGSSYRIEG